MLTTSPVSATPPERSTEGQPAQRICQEDRDGFGDREKTIELHDEALAITQELGMRPLTERILARRDILRA
ncbi:MAG TPA: hypothetical protein EYQ82_05040 [Dehalococcoidia bacterium]|jgi:hypothetical protein|nr:hypothetical protein [Dehalococcoidia bacterium]